MATEARSRFNKVYVPGLFMIGVDAFTRFSEDWRQFMTVKKSTQAYEEIAYMSGLGRAMTKYEGQSIYYDARIQGPSKKWVHTTKGLGLRITEEAIEDDLYDVMASGSKELGVSMAESINLDAFDMFNSTTKTTADGHVVFHASHHKLDGTTYSNTYTAASTSLDAIQNDIARYEALTDHRGKHINRVGGVNWVLANSGQEWKLYEIFNSIMNPNTANNAINTLKKARASLKYFTSPYITSTTARFYIGDKDPVRGPIWFSRRSPTFARDGDFETGDSLFKVTARYSVECADPMNIAENAGA
jgi:hypothetical protein